MNQETHEYLPSGEWEGFYCYGNSAQQHKMAIDLSFQNGNVSGSGTDDIAPFKWTGKYNTDSMKITMIKVYSTHEISYSGDIDENGIWGRWNNIKDLEVISSRFSEEAMTKIKKVFASQISGGFHIWPKNGNSNEESYEIEESEILKEIFEELKG